MKDQYFEICFVRMNKLRLKLALPLKTRDEMIELIDNSIQNDYNQTPEELREVWSKQETKAVSKIEDDAESDVKEGEDESIHAWIERINKRKKRAKEASDKRIDEAFAAMYINGKGKSVSEQNAYLLVWDSFDNALNFVWKELEVLFKSMINWLKEIWNSMYSFVSDFCGNIVNVFTSMFG